MLSWKKRLQALWQDQCGGLIAAEYLMIGTLLTIGILVGINAVKGAIIEQLNELAMLIGG